MLVQLGIGVTPTVHADARPVWSKCGQALCSCTPEPACPLCDAASPCESERVTPIFKRADRLGTTVQFLLASCVLVLGRSADTGSIPEPTPAGLSVLADAARPSGPSCAPEPPPPRAG